MKNLWVLIYKDTGEWAKGGGSSTTAHIRVYESEKMALSQSKRIRSWSSREIIAKKYVPGVELR